MKQSAETPVKIVVGKTFEKMVTKNKRDVAIAFVGLNNQQTQAFEREWIRLAKQFPQIDFVKIDMFKNDFPDVYKPSPHKPTVYFVPGTGDKSNPVEFVKKIGDDEVESESDAAFDAESLRKFIRENLKHKPGNDQHHEL